MTDNFSRYGRTWPDVLIELLMRWQALIVLLVAFSLVTSGFTTKRRQGIALNSSEFRSGGRALFRHRRPLSRRPQL